MDIPLPNGTHSIGRIPHGLPDSPTLEQLEHELPSINEGQVPLGELVSRVAQAVYAELTELAETCVFIFSLSTAARPRSQHAPHVRRTAETDYGGVGRENQEAGRQALCCSQVVPRRCCCSKSYGEHFIALGRRG